MVRIATALALSSSLLVACSSDAAPEPEPEVSTPGAFVSVDEGGGGLTLFRTLDQAVLSTGPLLIISVYDVHPASFDDARELAKNPAIPVGLEADFYPVSSLDTKPHEVVWFRTLTEDEEARIP